ncbi:hypothetical protein OKW41_002795 [Paraburkholderia sp. UCT70]
METCNKDTETVCDSIERFFPGSRIVHTLHVVCRAQFSVLSRMFSCLAGYDNALKTLQATRDEDLVQQRIVLTGIGEREARSIRTRLSQCEGVVRVRLEHMIQRVHANGR